MSRPYKVFNNPEAVIEGWFWLLRSGDLKRGEVRAVNLMGRELAVYRGANGRAAAMDAYCPHMGAHLAEGRVEGNELRCFFHRWKFDCVGRCSDIPSLRGQGPVPRVQVKTWPVEEKFGLIWLWTGAEPRHPVPFAPELEHVPVDSYLGGSFTKECHPNVLLINAIDEHHFASVHRLPVDLYMKAEEINENRIQFSNTTRVPPTNILTRFLSRFYSGALTYSMSYWYGSTGTVMLGPDFLHFYIMFALRPTKDGRTEGWTVLMTRKREGIIGIILNPILLFLTRLVGNYFASGDTRVFQTIRFHLKTPIKADHAIIDFIRHTERQPLSAWRTDSEKTQVSEAEYASQ